MIIDTTYDFRIDAGGKDPDRYSKTLKMFHQYLWSKSLPTGADLILDEKLENHSSVGEFRFASDSIIHTFSYWKSYQHIIQQIHWNIIEDFVGQSYTIGGMLIFPANKVNRKPTINGYRGMCSQIKDRIDLTLECIRLFYLGQESPLYDCLNRYRSFFDLFGDFKSYIEYFLLQDLTDEECTSIRFFHPFEQFGTHVLPGNKEEYLSYMSNCLEFVHKRNRRIAAWAQAHG